LKNDWISDGEFVDSEDIDGQSGALKWNKQGAQANWYFETSGDNASDRIPVKSDMGVGSSTEFIQDFLVDTFTTTVS
jgi:hypothetical protein